MGLRLLLAMLLFAGIATSQTKIDINTQTKGQLLISRLSSSSLTVNTSSPLAGGGSVSLGGTLTLTCTTCNTSSASVTSVGLTVNSTSPSGIFTVTGSPVTTSGTLNFNLAGTSGGVPYFSSGTVLSSSGALASGQFVLGGGAGSAPTTSFSVVPVANGGTGTGSTLTGLVRGSASAMTAAELSGDATTSGSNAVTLAAQYKIHDCEITTGDPGSASAVLANDNDTPSVCGNDFGVDYTITAVACWADAGSPTVTPILTGGSSTSILTGALTCGTASWASGTVNGTPTVHSFSSNGSTCSSTPCTVDANITTAGGTAKYIVIRIKRTL